MASAKPDHLLERICSESIRIFRACVAFVDLYEAVRRSVHLGGKKLAPGHGEGPKKQLDLEPYDRVLIVGGGTDGNDGPLPAAGAMVDPLTVKRGEEREVVAGEYLENNDVYHFFEKTDDLLLTGPTNTNVMDVRLILVR